MKSNRMDWLMFWLSVVCAVWNIGCVVMIHTSIMAVVTNALMAVVCALMAWELYRDCLKD